MPLAVDQMQLLTANGITGRDPTSYVGQWKVHLPAIPTPGGDGLINEVDWTVPLPGWPGLVVAFYIGNDLDGDPSRFAADQIIDSAALPAWVTYAGSFIAPEAGLTDPLTLFTFDGTWSPFDLSTSITVDAAGSDASWPNWATAVHVDGFTPSHAGAGDTVVITGVGFTGATALGGGGTPFASFAVDSDTQITAVLDASGGGNQLIKVLAADGFWYAALDWFYFDGPIITSLTPTANFAGTTLTITGVVLTGADTVAFDNDGFGGSPINAAATVVNPTTVQCVIPGTLSAGPHHVQVTRFGTAPIWYATGTLNFTVGPIPDPPIGGVQFLTANGIDPTDEPTYVGHWKVHIPAIPSPPGDGSINELDFAVPYPGAPGMVIGVYLATTTGDPVPGSAAHFAADQVIDSAAIPAWIVAYGVMIKPADHWNGGRTEPLIWDGGYTIYDITPTTDFSIDVGNSDPSWQGWATAFHIDSITPAHAVPGETVVIAGAGFTGADYVSLRSVVGSFTVDSDTQITAVVGVGGGDGDTICQIETPTHFFDALFLWHFDGPLIYDTVTPTHGPPGTTIVIHGIRLTGADTVGFPPPGGGGGPRYPLSFVSDTEVRVVIPALSPPVFDLGPYGVEVLRIDTTPTWLATGQGRFMVTPVTQATFGTSTTRLHRVGGGVQ